MSCVKPANQVSFSLIILNIHAVTAFCYDDGI